jgi:glycosyltransferase involved in cell wall biosynthesis
MDLQLRRAWGVQPHFEKVADRLIGDNYEDTGITWGWGYPEGEDLGAARWAFTECGAFIHQPSEINLEGYAPQDSVLSIFSGDYLIAGPAPLRGAFSISFLANAGKLIFSISAKQLELDPRPLGIRVSRLAINGKPLDLSLPTLLQNQLTSLTAEKIFRLLDQAAEESRTAHGVRLTDGRGPWSRGLESFIADHVADYDLVITHNNVFRPAVFAIEEARKKGVPSILIPHAHLDDDFYHFPDWLESARNASLVLVVPRAACDFLSEKGCNVRYLPAGCDADEEFTAEDKEAFERVYQSPRRFILVLGRKAGAKGYRQIIDAVEQINREGVDLQAVLIGPDDDGIPVDSPNAVYLGRQPRNVVRGALLSCIALCNMSVSESFGIVLLEAWLAGKPVIANKDCSAFHDMAIHEKNAILVKQNELQAAIQRLVLDPQLGQILAKEGKALVSKFSWTKVTDEFVHLCQETCEFKR